MDYRPLGNTGLTVAGLGRDGNSRLGLGRGASFDECVGAPHVPHNWDAGLIYEETTGMLFSSDLFTQTGPADPTTESDIVAPAITVAERLPFMPLTPMAAPTLRRLSRAEADDDRADARADVQGRWGGGAGGVGGALRTRCFSNSATTELILSKYL